MDIIGCYSFVYGSCKLCTRVEGVRGSGGQANKCAPLPLEESS